MSAPLKFTFTDYLTRSPDLPFDGVEAGPEKLLHSLQAHTIDVAVTPAGMEEPGVLSRPLRSERLMAVLLDDNHLIENERIYW